MNAPNLKFAMCFFLKESTKLSPLPDFQDLSYQKFKDNTLSVGKTCSSKGSMTRKVLEGADRTTLVGEDINPSETIKRSLANTTKYTSWELAVEFSDTST